MTAVLVVCPSITVQLAESFCAAAQTAIDSGADLRAVLVANSRGTQALADRWPDMVVPGANAGFAASINQGAAAGGDFRWLVVANDDYAFDTKSFLRLADYLAAEPADSRRLIRLTREEPWRPVPGVAGVFGNLSLLERVPSLLGYGRTEWPDAPSGRCYLPLALAAISGSLWRATGGLDEALPFCYEDAWFARRALGQHGGWQLSTYDTGLQHAVSLSTTARIDVVFPVIAWSALAYLRLIGVPSLLARWICLSALIVRIPLSLGARANRAKHLRGIARSVTAILADRRPSLPRP